MATTGLNRAARTGNRREVARRLGLNVELSRQGDKKRADAGELLSDFSRIWGLANLEERKRLLRASLEAAYIEKSAITAVKPRPEFYNLIYQSSGPDGCRVRMTDKALIVTWLHPHYQHQTAYAQVSLA